MAGSGYGTRSNGRRSGTATNAGVTAAGVTAGATGVTVAVNTTAAAAGTAAAGTTTAAAAASGTAAAGNQAGNALPPQKTPEELALDELDLALYTCGVQNAAGRSRLIKSQGLTGVNDLASLKEKDVKSLIETFNETCKGAQTVKDQHIGFMPIKKICALSYAVGKCMRMNEVFSVYTWDAAAIAAARNEMDNLLTDDKAQEPTSIRRIDDKTIDASYEDWRSTVDTQLGQMSSVSGNGLRLDYIVRGVTAPVQLVMGDHDKIKYAAPLVGAAYERDNRKVWSLLKVSSEQSKAYAYIQKYDRTQDGRAGMLELDKIFLGPDFVQKRITIVLQIVNLGNSSSAMYSGETSGYSFTTYAGTLIKSYAYIELHRSKVDEITQVQRLVGGITGDAKSRLQYAIEATKDNHSTSMHDAVSYLSGKVNEAYSEFLAKAGGRGGSRKISQTDQRRGGQGGRGGRFGRGGGRGHHGRGRGHDDARDFDGRTEIKQINGCDVSDKVVRDSFPPDVFKGKLAAYVHKRRAFLNNNYRRNGGNKRQIQELTSMVKELKEDMKRRHLGNDEDDTDADGRNGEHVNVKSEKGGQAGATFGKNARKRN